VSRPTVAEVRRRLFGHEGGPGGPRISPADVAWVRRVLEGRGWVAVWGALPTVERLERLGAVEVGRRPGGWLRVRLRVRLVGLLAVPQLPGPGGARG